MEDVHMETPPASLAELTESPLAAQEPTAEQHAFRRDMVRSNLGKSIVQDFGYFRDILEEHHDRRERIIKVSRDINNISKKMIFALHRAEPRDFLPQFTASSETLIEFKEKHETVLKLFHRVAVDLQGCNYHRYQRSISGPMQEYIEAMTLEYYLVHGKLMPKSALEAHLVFTTTPEQLANPDLIIAIGQFGSEGGRSGGGGGGGQRGKSNKDNRKGPYNKDRKDAPKKPTNPAPASSTSSSAAENSPSTAPSSPMIVEANQLLSATVPQPPASSSTAVQLTLEVTDEDYLLGIADLTGELMRLAINTLGQSLMPTTTTAQENDGQTAVLLSPEQRVRHILQFLRDIKSGFDGLSLTKMSPISKKMGVLRQSLQKIELACYNVKVRGAEYPPEVLRQMLMSGQDLGGGGGGDSGGGGNEDEE
ncbi:MAG: Translin family-domain-containing protein [Linnemannia gamsii]|nr:MAG: Translin family-domain-containing protein [Linnemannia gamsii]